MEIDIFGKEDCGKCETAKKKIEAFLSERDLTDKVQLRYLDVESIDGMAEGAFYDVLKIPTIIIKNKDKNVARWDGSVPEAEEVESFLEKEVVNQ
ncbi:MAG: thioredoxin family protein [Candidatus Anammoxibacter sp.]